MAEKTPNLFIPGAPKSGTTYLYTILQAHKDIYFPEIKELNYFSYPELVEQSYYREFKIGKLERYLNQFKKGKNSLYLADGSVSYFAYHSVPKKLHKFNPDAKLLFTLRNPIKRAFSHYQMDVRMGNTKESFEALLKSEKGNPFFTQYIQNSLYFDNINKYLQFYPKEQIHVIFLERMEQEIDGILDFLELDKTEYIIPSVEAVNANKKPKNAIARFVQKNRNLVTIVKPFVPKSLIKSANNSLYEEADKLTLDKDTEIFLFKTFKDDIQNLSDLLSIDLVAFWNLEHLTNE